MAKMRHNGTVMEASSHRYHLDFHGTEEEYSDGKAKLFSRTMDLERHRKVVKLNVDDPNAHFFISQGNSELPVVTFAIENKKADVYPCI
ncbi:hypothetical protein ACOSQ4_024824 [Xanthoceras sorbifolium]